MKNLLNTLLIIIIFHTAALAQLCPEPTSTALLDANNAAAHLRINGIWESDFNAPYKPYRVPTDNPVTDIPALEGGSLWMAAFDEDDNLVVSASIYGSGWGRNAGPLDEDGITDAATCANYDQFWEVEKTEIDAFKIDWSDGVLDNTVPESILAWPAKGNPHFEDIHGFALSDTPQGMAPFSDVNSDGIYDPMDGDFPNVKDADQGIWWVYNTVSSPNNQSVSSMPIEVHMLAYAFESSDEYVNTATFYDMKIINRGGALDSMFMALWIDPMLGCDSDDYIGCIPEENMAIMYNADAEDGETGCSCPGGVSTYCQAPPMLGLKIIKGADGGRVFGNNGELYLPSQGTEPDTIIDCGLSSFIHYLNGGQTPPAPTGMTDPDNLYEYYNYLNGKWKDGTPITVGGNGYDPGGNGTEVKHIYSDSPCDAMSWSMFATNAPERDDYLVLSSGPFQMQNGDVNQMTYAMIHTSDVSYTPCPSFDAFDDALESIDFRYQQSVVTVAPSKPTLFAQAIPNPFSEQTTLLFPKLEKENVEVLLYSMEGRLVRSYKKVTDGRLTMDREGLVSGMYFYKLRTDDGRYGSGKLGVF